MQRRDRAPAGHRDAGADLRAVAGHNGDVFAYRALVQHLAPDQPFFGLQPAGRRGGSVPLTSVEDMARYFAAQIRAFRPTGPMSIAGYCAGGTVAFELARQLTAAGADVTNPILFGAPYCTSYRPLRIRAAQARYLAGRSVTHARTLLQVPASERRRYLAAMAAPVDAAPGRADLRSGAGQAPARRGDDDGRGARVPPGPAAATWM